MIHKQVQESTKTSLGPSDQKNRVTLKKVGLAMAGLLTAVSGVLGFDSRLREKSVDMTVQAVGYLKAQIQKAEDFFTGYVPAESKPNEFKFDAEPLLPSTNLSQYEPSQVPRLEELLLKNNSVYWEQSNAEKFIQNAREKGQTELYVFAFYGSEIPASQEFISNQEYLNKIVGEDGIRREIISKISTAKEIMVALKKDKKTGEAISGSGIVLETGDRVADTDLKRQNRGKPSNTVIASNLARPVESSDWVQPNTGEAEKMATIRLNFNPGSDFVTVVAPSGLDPEGNVPFKGIAKISFDGSIRLLVDTVDLKGVTTLSALVVNK